MKYRPRIVCVLLTVSVAPCSSFAAAGERYQIINYFGMTVHMHDVNVCPSYNEILKKNVGFICFSPPSETKNYPNEYGCLIRQKNNVLRTGFWFDWNETRNAYSIRLMGDYEEEVGSSIYFNEHGHSEIRSSDMPSKPVTACRVADLLKK